MESKKARIIVTGGHATPAIACIHELKKRGYSDIIYVGQKKSLLFDKNVSSEYRLITEQEKLSFKSIIAGKLSLFASFSSLVWILRLPIGFIQAFWWHMTLKPDVVLTFGSHVGVPVAYCAKLFKIPVVAHEQTVTLGRANAFIQRLATSVCYSWEASVAHIEDTSKFVYTGNPIRQELLESNSNSFVFQDPSKKMLFITGGNQGAHTLNTFIFNSLNKLAEKFNIIHQTGSNSIYNDYQKGLDLAKDINVNGVSYIPVNYIFIDQMAEAYAKASIVIGRAGANTITELLALSKKALLIPIPTSSGNEQFLNAKLMEDLGLARIINQIELDSTDLIKVLDEILSLSITDLKKLKQISDSHKGAEVKICDVIETNI
jgi:UDP-N-acetylglucosamine--N-acetylmuramyl-(pentapeptide) pyrophosphoryl-undecaprenol N-acetylglucosamine transferase